MAVLSALLYTLAVTFIIIKVIDATIGVRVHEKEETIGIDLAEHNERAYTLID